MPVTSRGKLDRKRLPPPPADLGMGEGDFVPCESRTEKVIEAVWQELLGYDDTPISALGDFVAPGLASPLAAGSAGAAPPAAGAGGPLCLELRDGATFRRRRARWLRAAAAKLFPPPARYTLVWHLPGGDRAVYGWAPVPPSADFVALGHVATRTAAEPPPAAARCAHVGLCEALGPLAAVGHAPAWTNSSLGGAAGAVSYTHLTLPTILLV